MTRTTILLTALLAAICASGTYCAETADAPNAETPKADTTSTPAGSVMLALSFENAKPTEILEAIAKQAKQKILIESTVKGKVTMKVEDVTLELALRVLCKAGGFEWRKIYLPSDSKLLEQPDKLAATVRLLSGLSFPDIVIAGSLDNRVAVHSEDKKAMKTAEDKLVKDLGLTCVYLITNDAAVAAKKTDEEEKEPKAVEDYIDGSKKLMDLFMNMTPEERERALVEAINLMDQVGPGYMSSVMQTMLDSDPALLKQVMGRQTQMLFGMDETARRRMLRLNMAAAAMITPEQMEILKEDQKAIMEEMQREGGNQPQLP